MLNRRTTYLVDLREAGVVENSAVQGFYTATLNALRWEGGHVVADLLSRTEPLPPQAKQAALTLQRQRPRSLFMAHEQNPFRAVVVNAGIDEHWEALLTLAPYSPNLSIELSFFTTLFHSEGGLETVRLKLTPQQLAQVRAQLDAATDVPPWLRLRERGERRR